MNHVYRVIFNRTLGCWQAVTELTNSSAKLGGSVKRALKRALTSHSAKLAAVAAMAAGTGGLAGQASAQNALAPNQLPQGGNVTAGSAQINQSGNVMNIDQSTQKAIINWQEFNVGQDARVNFNQPGVDSATLNRVLDANPSQIFGQIVAPGQVILINPNGAYFAPSASVDVGGLIATTHELADKDFLDGNYQFKRNGATGKIINDGELKARLDGYIALMAPEVRNQGVIIAERGTVALASGEHIQLDFGSGNRLQGITVTEQDLDAQIENKHAIIAEGGLVILSARATAELRASVIKNSGEIVASAGANTVTMQGGRIILDGGATGEVQVSGQLMATADSSQINNDQASPAKPKGGQIEIAAKTVEITQSAKLDVSGDDGGQVNIDAKDSATIDSVIAADGSDGRGGLITVEADHITLKDNAQLTATGKTGGGDILVGGDWQGGANVERRVFDDPSALRQAITVSMDQGALIDASATDNGKGGTVVLWSDVANPASVTAVHGSIYAMGGQRGGDGGQIETSGATLITDGVTGSAQAPEGLAGDWLFDPSNVQIVDLPSEHAGSFSAGTWTPTGNQSIVRASTIESLINGGTNVTITTTGAGSQAGNITVAASILTSRSGNARTLTLRADNDIIIAGVIRPLVGTLNLKIDAQRDVDIRAPLTNSSTTVFNVDIQTGRDVQIVQEVDLRGQIKIDTPGLFITGFGTPVTAQGGIFRTGGGLSSIGGDLTTVQAPIQFDGDVLIRNDVTWRTSGGSGGVVRVDGNIDSIATIAQQLSGTGTFTRPEGVSHVELLLVGGGGAGGYGGSGSGGGGAGGVVYLANVELTSSTYQYRVGAGGTGMQSGTPVSSNNGQSTTFGTTLIPQAAGGGHGFTNTSTSTPAGAGGSGGGGVTNPGGRVVGQGHFGGRGVSFSSGGSAGGGGGAVSAGTSGSSTVAGSGGDGFVSAISGVQLTYATGGGASGQGVNGGSGGSGDINNNAFNAFGGPRANTGSGGGARSGSNAGFQGGVSQPGASGTIVVRYQTAGSSRLTIDAGDRDVSISGAMGASSPMGTVDIRGVGIDLAGNVHMADNQALVIRANGSVQSHIRGGISGSGARLEKRGNGDLLLHQPSTYTGPTEIHFGSITNARSRVLPEQSTLDIRHGGTFHFHANGTENIDNGVQAVGGLAGGGLANNLGVIHAHGDKPFLRVGSNNQSTTFNGQFTQSGDPLTLEKVGTGDLTLALRDSQNYAGDVRVFEGGLAIGQDSDLGGGPNGRGRLILTGGHLSVLGSMELDSRRQFSVDQASSIFVPGGATFTYRNSILGSGDISLTGSGTFVLQNATSGSRVWRIGSGSTFLTSTDQAVGNQSDIYLEDTATWRIGALASQSIRNLGGQGKVVANGLLRISPREGGSLFVGEITGIGHLIKNGPHEFGLRGSLSLPGVTLNDGAMRLWSSGSSTPGGTLGTTDLKIAPGASLIVGNPAATVGSISATTPSLTALINLSGSQSALRVRGESDFAGQITGSGSLIVDADVTLRGKNTYTGSTDLRSGSTLQLVGEGVLGALINSDGSISSTATGNYSGAITLNGDLMIDSIRNQDLRGAMSGSGSIFKTGPARLGISNAGQLQSTITVAAGDMRLLANNALSSSVIVELLGSGELDLNDRSTNVAKVISDSAQTLIRTRASGVIQFRHEGDYLYAGQIGGSGRVVKHGSGVWTQTGRFNSNVRVSVNGGTLRFLSDTPEFGRLFDGSGRLIVEPVSDSFARAIVLDAQTDFAGLSFLRIGKPGNRADLTLNRDISDITEIVIHAGNLDIRSNRMIGGSGNKINRMAFHVDRLTGSGSIDMPANRDFGTELLISLAQDSTFAGYINVHDLYLTGDAGLALTGSLLVDSEITISQGASLIMAPTSTLSSFFTSFFSADIRLAGGTFIYQSDQLEMLGNVVGDGSLVLDGEGLLYLDNRATYTGATEIRSGTLVFRGSVPTMATSSISGSGQLVVRPVGSSFPTPLSFTGWSLDASLGGLTIGGSSNTQRIHLDQAIEISGPINVYGQRITVGHNLSTSGAAIRLRGDVVVDGNVSIDSTGGGGSSAGGIIQFFGTLDSDAGQTRDLTLSAGQSSIQFNGIIGEQDRLGTLTLSSAQDVVFESSVTLGRINQTQKGSGVFRVDQPLTLTSGNTVINTTTIDLNAAISHTGSGSIAVTANSIALSDSIQTRGGNINLTAVSGGITAANSAVLRTRADANTGVRSGNVLLAAQNSQGNIEIGAIDTSGADHNSGAASHAGNVTLQAGLVLSHGRISADGGNSITAAGGNAGNIEIAIASDASLLLLDPILARGGTGSQAGIGGEVTLRLAGTGVIQQSDGDAQIEARRLTIISRDVPAESDAHGELLLNNPNNVFNQLRFNINRPLSGGRGHDLRVVNTKDLQILSIGSSSITESVDIDVGVNAVTLDAPILGTQFTVHAGKFTSTTAGFWGGYVSTGGKFDLSNVLNAIDIDAAIWTRGGDLLFGSTNTVTNVRAELNTHGGDLIVRGRIFGLWPNAVLVSDNSTHNTRTYSTGGGNVILTGLDTVSIAAHLTTGGGDLLVSHVGSLSISLLTHNNLQILSTDGGDISITDVENFETRNFSINTRGGDFFASAGAVTVRSSHWDWVASELRIRGGIVTQGGQVDITSRRQLYAGIIDTNGGNIALAGGSVHVGYDISAGSAGQINFQSKTELFHNGASTDIRISANRINFEQTLDGCATCPELTLEAGSGGIQFQGSVGNNERLQTLRLLSEGEVRGPTASNRAVSAQRLAVRASGDVTLASASNVFDQVAVDLLDGSNLVLGNQGALEIAAIGTDDSAISGLTGSSSGGRHSEITLNVGGALTQLSGAIISTPGRVNIVSRRFDAGNVAIRNVMHSGTILADTLVAGEFELASTQGDIRLSSDNFLRVGNSLVVSEGDLAFDFDEAVFLQTGFQMPGRLGFVVSESVTLTQLGDTVTVTGDQTQSSTMFDMNDAATLVVISQDGGREISAVANVTAVSLTQNNLIGGPLSITTAGTYRNEPGGSAVSGITVTDVLTGSAGLELVSAGDIHVAGVDGAASLTIQANGQARLGSVTTTGAQTYAANQIILQGQGYLSTHSGILFDAPVRLASDVDIEAASITFAGALDSYAGVSELAAHDLSLSSGLGDIAFKGAVGASQRLGQVTIDAARHVTIGESAAHTLSAAALRQIDRGTGTFTLNAALDTHAGPIDIDSEAVKLNADINHTADRNTSPGVFIASGAGGITLLAGSAITTTAARAGQTSGDIILDAGGDIDLKGDLITTGGEGGHGGAVDILAVGSIGVANITTSGGQAASGTAQNGGDAGDVYISSATGVITLRASTITSVGGAGDGGARQGEGAQVLIETPVMLADGSVTIDIGETGFAVIFDHTVKGNQDLTITAGAGDIIFGEAVGGVDPANRLGQLLIESADTVEFIDTVMAAGIVQRQGSGSTLFFDSAHTNSSTGVNIKSREIDFYGNVTTLAGGGVTLEAATEIMLDDAILVDSAGAVILKAPWIVTGADIKTSDKDVSFQGATEITRAVDIDTTIAGGSISFIGKLDGGEDLTLTAGLGNITFAGEVGGVDALGTVTIHEAARVTITHAFRASALDQRASTMGTGTFVLNGDLDITGGDIAISSVSVALNANITANAGAMVIRTNELSGSGNLEVPSDRSITINQSGSSSFLGGLKAGDFIKTGGGALTLGGVIEHAGSTTINGGTLVLQSDAARLGNRQVNGTGLLRIEPQAVSFDHEFRTSDWTFATTLGGLTIGKAGNTANITIGQALSIAGDVTLFGGDIAVNSSLSSASTISLWAGGSITQAAPITTPSLALLGGTVLLTDVGNAVSVLAGGTLSDPLASLSFVNADTLEIGSVNPDGIYADGDISISTVTGDLVVSQNISTMSDTVTAIVLNAGTSADIAAQAPAPGSDTEGNIVITNGATITVGPGGLATLYTGSLADSLGLVQSAPGADDGLIELGATRLRYGSNATTTRYAFALTSGLNAIYREQPTLSLALDDVTMTYGDLEPAPGTTVSDLINGDDPAFALGSLVFEVVADVTDRSTSNNLIVGDYVIQLLSVQSRLGYKVSSTAGTLTVDPRTVTLGGVTAQSKVYDGSDSATLDLSAPSFANMVEGDSLTVTAASGTFATRDVGVNQLITLSGFSYGGADAGNYLFIDQVTTSADINLRPITLTADAATKVYGEFDPTLTFTPEALSTGRGLIAGDEFVGSISRASGENVGSYAINQGALANSNYDITWVSNDLTITPRAITLAADSVSKIYGDANANLSVSIISGSLGSQTVSDSIGDVTGVLSRASGADVGQYDILLGTGSRAGNYTITFEANNQAFSITPRPITLTANAATKVYGEADPALTFSAEGNSSGRGLVAGDTFSGSAIRVAGEDVGDYAIEQGSVDNTNYTITWVERDLSITPRPITLTADAATRVYGEVDPTFSFSIEARSASRGLVAGDTFSGNAIRVAGEDVGDYAIEQGSVDNTNYTITWVERDLTIAPRPITLTANAATKVYGEFDPTLTFTPEAFSAGRGLVAGDVFVGGISRASGENVGSYAINQGTLTNSNYDITWVSNDLTITPRAITLAADPVSKIYGDINPNLSVSITSGSLGSQTVSDSIGDVTGVLSRASGADVGQYDILLGTGSRAGNYTITFAANNQAFSITPRPITLTANVATKVYGEADPALTFSAEGNSSGRGLVAGDTFSGSAIRVAGEDVGDYAIEQGSVDNTNYAITWVERDLTITPRAITLVADSASKIYGQTDPSLSVSLVSGSLVTGFGYDLQDVVGAVNRESGEDVDSYNIILGSSRRAMNYDITFNTNNQAFSITPRPIMLTANAATRIYGEADPTFSFSIEARSASRGLVAGDTFGGSAIRVAGEDVGDYAIEQGSVDNANYTITWVEQDLTIAPRPITLTADAATKVYGEFDPTLTFTPEAFSAGRGLVAGDVFVGGISRTSGENVGSYAINQGTLTNSNYDITWVSNDLTITPRAITLTADPVSKIYGDLDPGLSVSITAGSLGSQTVSDSIDDVTGVLSRASGADVGQYDILLGAGSRAGNYTITFAANNQAFSITPRPITLTADAATKVYGEADPALTFSAEGNSSGRGLVAGDTFSGSAIRVAGEDVGDYAIEQGSVDNTNYTITWVERDLTITPRPITLTADAATKVYGEFDPTLTFTPEAFAAGRGLVAGDTFSGSAIRVAGEDVGDYAIEQGSVDNTNYTITWVEQDLTITPRPITLTADAATKVYGEFDPTLTFTPEAFATGRGLVAGDAFVGSITRASGENVGSYVINQGTLTNSNYDITWVSNDLTITPRAITFAANSATKVYGDLDPTLSVSIAAGSLGSQTVTDSIDDVTGVLSRASGADVGQYDILLGTGSRAGNYTITFATNNQAFSITPRPITLTANAATKIYGEADPTLTFSAEARSASRGLIAGDTFSGILVRVAGEDVGDYAIEQGSVDNTNYAITWVEQDLSITPRPITLVANAATKVYGDLDPTLSVSIAGGSLADMLGDTLAEVTGAVTRELGQNVGLYDILLGAGAARGNYAITFEADNNAFEITPARLVATGTKVYDGSVLFAGSDLTVAGVNGEQFTATGSGVMDTKHVKSDQALVSVAGLSLSAQGDALLSNYELLDVSDTSISVTPRSVTLSATGVAKTYDATMLYDMSADDLAALSAQLVGGDSVVGAELVFDSANVSRDANGNVLADRVVTLSNVQIDDGNLGANYIVSTTDATDGRIDPAALTITAVSDAKFVTQADPNGYLGVIYNGFVGGEDATVAGLFTQTGSVSRTNTGQAAQTYEGVLMPAGWQANNYEITFEAGDFTIVPADTLLVRVPGGIDKTYGQALPQAQDITAQYLDSQDNQIKSLVVSFDGGLYRITDGAGSQAVFGLDAHNANRSGAGLIRAGGYNVAPTEAQVSGANFQSLVLVGAVTVAPKTLNNDLGITEVSKVYDGNRSITGLDLNFDEIIAGVIGGDAVSLLGQGVFEDRHVGTNKMVTLALALRGEDANSYRLSTNTVTDDIGTITQRESVTWVGADGGNWSDARNWQDGALPDRDNVATVVIAQDSVVTYDSDQVGVTSSAIANEGTIRFASSDAFTLTNAISGTGGIEQRGTGLLTLAGDSTFTGSTDIGNYALEVSANNALGAGNLVSDDGRLTIRDGVTLAGLNVTGPITLASSVISSGSQTYEGAITLAAGTHQSPLVIQSTAGDVTLNSTVSAGPDAKEAKRSLELQAANRVTIGDQIGLPVKEVLFGQYQGTTHTNPYSLRVQGGEIYLLADVTTFEEQRYVGPVFIGDNGSNGFMRTLISLDPRITFTDSVDAVTEGVHGLDVRAYTLAADLNEVPTIDFEGPVGQQRALFSLFVDVGLQNQSPLALVGTPAPNQPPVAGRVNLLGDVRTIGSQTYRGLQVVLGANGQPIVLRADTGAIDIIVGVGTQAGVVGLERLALVLGQQAQVGQGLAGSLAGAGIALESIVSRVVPVAPPGPGTPQPPTGNPLPGEPLNPDAASGGSVDPVAVAEQLALAQTALSSAAAFSVVANDQQTQLERETSIRLTEDVLLLTQAEVAVGELQAVVCEDLSPEQALTCEAPGGGSAGQ